MITTGGIALTLFHPLMIMMAERTAVLSVVVFLLMRVKAFRSVLNQRATRKEKLIIVIIFSIISILGTYLGVPFQDAIANSRVIGAVAAGLLGGPWVGLATGLIAGIHRYTLGGFTGLACAISTIAEALFAGLISRWYKNESIGWPFAMLVCFIAEWMQMGIILLVAKPYVQALELVKVISLPMAIVNSIGMAVFMIIVDLVQKEEERIGALQAQRTLQIADNILACLHQGLHAESAAQVAKEILQTTRVAAVAITDTKQVLAHVGVGCNHHIAGQPIQTEATRQVLIKREVTLANSKQEIGCGDRHCSLRSAILVPLFLRREVVGVLKLYQDHSRKLSAVDLELVRGLGTLISTQLELAELEKQSRLLADAEIRALHAQINPHFLFNALNTIVSFIRFRPEKARELLIHLGDYFRRNLHDSGGFVTLEEELQHVEAYLAIERARFDDKLQVTYEIDPSTRHLLVPGLILQPLVENAIKHGLLPKRDGGIVTISSKRTPGNILELQVSDNGVGMKHDPFDASAEQKGMTRKLSGIGLANVKSRVKSIYGAPYDITFQSSPNEGTVCTIHLPAGVKADAKSVYR